MIRPRPIHIVVVLVVVLVLGCMSLAIFRAREPRYQGRTLSEWISDGAGALGTFRAKPNADRFHPETDPDWQVASHAVKQMAPDAIPFLLRWVEAKDPPLKVTVIDWLNHHLSFHMSARSASGDHDVAQLGFWLLGSESKPAWPVLINWTHSTEPDRRLLAFVCLTASKPDQETLMPVLLRMIHDPNKEVQFTASQVCVYMNPQAAEASGVYKMFPVLKKPPTYQPAPIQTPME